jgi:tetratricopeptide (TPR) repeat protein
MTGQAPLERSLERVWGRSTALHFLTFSIYCSDMKKPLFIVAIVAIFLVGLALAYNEGYIKLPNTPAKQPSLSHEVVFTQELPNETEDRIRGNILINQEKLQKEPKDLETWLDLALQYKEAGDLEATEDVWKYLNEAFSGQETSLFNLGVLYHQDLKEYDKSEKSYREAIKRNPAYSLSYLGLHELYRYSYKQDTTLAVEILLEGMEQIPNDPNLPIALAAYYRDYKKDYETSIEYIKQAQKILKEMGDTEKIQALEEEILRLSK